MQQLLEWRDFFFGRFLSEFEAVGWMRLLKKIFDDVGLRTSKNSESDSFFPFLPFLSSLLSAALERVLIAFFLVRFSITQDIFVG